MGKRKLLLTVCAICLVVLALSLSFYFLQRPSKLPSWPAIGDYMTYAQNYSWNGGNATQYMTWNVTGLNGDLASVHLISHGVAVSSDGEVTFPESEVEVAINTTDRTVLSLSDQSNSGEMPVGSKWNFWIPTSTKLGDAIETAYGTSSVSPAQTINVMGKNESCWVVSYVYSSGNDMTRLYDIAIGICLQIQTHLVRGNVTLSIVETAVQTNAPV